MDDHTQLILLFFFWFCHRNVLSRQVSMTSDIRACLVLFSATFFTPYYHYDYSYYLFETKLPWNLTLGYDFDQNSQRYSRYIFVNFSNFVLRYFFELCACLSQIFALNSAKSFSGFTNNLKI